MNIINLDMCPILSKSNSTVLFMADLFGEDYGL